VGKISKTYIAAVALTVLAITGLVVGQISGAGFVILISLALGMFGIRDHQERKAKAILDAVLEVKNVVADVKAGKKIDVLGEVGRVESIAQPFISGENSEGVGAK
jgi:uncharacterized protein (DUF58 family)